MNDDTSAIDVTDLGDAMIETKQCSPAFIWPDSWFQWGTQPWSGGGPPQC